MREKLIELLSCDCNAEFCEDCEFENDESGCVRRQKEIIADHLLANGVVISEMETPTQKWISVAERLPEDGEVNIICDKRNNVFTSQWCEAYEGWVGDSWATDRKRKDVTYWMPLPQPPKEGE